MFLFYFLVTLKYHHLFFCQIHLRLYNVIGKILSQVPILQRRLFFEDFFKSF